MTASADVVATKLRKTRTAWTVLDTHYKKVSKLHLRELFAEDPTRGERMAIEAVGLYLDYSKNRITDETFKILLKLAKDAGLKSRIEAMFSGAEINITEKRAGFTCGAACSEGCFDSGGWKERRA